MGIVNEEMGDVRAGVKERSEVCEAKGLVAPSEDDVVFAAMTDWEASTST